MIEQAFDANQLTSDVAEALNKAPDQGVAGLAGAPQPARQGLLDLRFIPDRVLPPKGDLPARLRATLLVMPADLAELRNWPDRMATLLKQGVDIYLTQTTPPVALDPTKAIPAKVVTPQVPQSNLVWQALMYPGPTAKLRTEHQRLRKKLEHLQRSTKSEKAATLLNIFAYNEALNDPRPSRELSFRRNQSAPADVLARFRISRSADPAAAPAGVPFIHPTPFIQLEERFVADQAATIRSQLQNKGASPAPSIWSASISLFQPAGNDQTQDSVIADKALALRVTTARKQLHDRGLKAAREGARRGNLSLDAVALRDPFHRFTSDPGPQPVIAGNVDNEIARVLARNLSAATALHDSLTHSTRTDGVRVLPVAAIAHAAPANVRTGISDEDSIKQALVAYLLAIRPDEEFASETTRGLGYGSEEVHSLLKSLSEVQERRIFGLLAHPALARAFKLVVDVEIALDKLPAPPDVGEKPLRLYAAAVFEGVTAKINWTACQISPPLARTPQSRLFTPCCQDEMTGAAPASCEYLYGLLNLRQQVKLANEPNPVARFVVGSLDVPARAEQHLNKAASIAAARRAGSTTDFSETPARTAGLIIRDRLATDKVARDMKRAGQWSSASDQFVLFTEDLVTGYRADVAVQPRKQGSAASWRRLTRRIVEYKNVAGVNLERLANEGLAPGLTAQGRRELRDQIDEASVMPVSREVSVEAPTPENLNPPAEVVALDTVLQWEGDPLGAPCTREMKGIEVEPYETATDLALPFELDLPRDGDLPPRLEFNRSYKFGLRCTYPGGGGVPYQLAHALYDELGLSSPFKRFERHERLAAPLPGVIHPAPAAKPGDTLATLIIRRGQINRFRTSIARRVVFLQGVPLNFAAAHAHTDGTRRALDHPHPLAGKRPMGGLVNLDLDPVTGGLPVKVNGRIVYASASADEPVAAPRTVVERARSGKPQDWAPRSEGVFRVRKNSASRLERREAQYYPDPTAEKISFQLWTRGENAVAIPGEQLYLPVYDDRYYQDGVGDWSARALRSTFPHAMPVIVEVSHAEGSEQHRRLAFNEGYDTGYLERSGEFERLSLGQDPPQGSLTVRRVRVELRRGEDLDLRCWTVARDSQLSAFAAAGTLISLRTYASLNALAQSLAANPAPAHAEVLDLRCLSAVQRPRPPEWPATDDALKVLRKDLPEDRWRAELEKVRGDWAGNHEIGASMTWLGGTLEVDRAVTEKITLLVSHEDVRDEPGRPIEIDKSGRPKVHRKGPVPLTLKLLPVSVASSRLTPIDLVVEASNAQPLFVNLPDSRAYKLFVEPVATSRFVRALTDKEEPDSLFSTSGEVRVVWAPATRRPDPMGYVEFLPAFVWTSNFQDGSQFTRRTFARLMWRRFRRSSNVEGREASGAWFSSGAGERFAIVLRPGKEPSATDLGPLDRIVTQWGADPIRWSMPREEWDIPARVFSANEHATAVPEMWVPFPGENDRGETEEPPVRQPRDAPRRPDAPGSLPPEAGQAGGTFARKMDLLTFEPHYDEAQDAWYVDVQIDLEFEGAGKDVIGPWVRLGLARYQEHAMIDRMDPRRDLRVSTPTDLQFRLEPRRSVKVSVGRRDPRTRLWPIAVTVSGPLAVTSGGADQLPAELKRQFQHLSRRPRFKARLLHSPTTLLDEFGEGGDEVVYSVTSDDDPSNVSGDILWTTTLYARRNPRRARYSVFIEETDVMLSAHVGRDVEEEAITDVTCAASKPCEMLVESGPRFMAKIPVRKR